MPVYKQDLDAIHPGLTANQNGVSNGIHVTNGARLNGNTDHRPPFEVCQDGVLGRHLVATRDILPGEVILQEAPLVTGPPTDFLPCCVTCYKAVTRKCHKTCGKGCGWPVCNDICAEASTHQPECDVTRNIRKEKVSIDSWDAPSALYESLAALRCLAYRETDPAAWARLSRLEAHAAKRRGSARWERDRRVVVPTLREYFRMDVAEEEVLRICGILQVNGYGVSWTKPSYIALYDELSFIEHHCIPNCSKTWSTSGALTVHTASFVPSGRHLSICYTDPLWGTAQRRDHLARELLLCRCNRCADPSECGTNFSALRCDRQGCDGLILAEDPLADVGRVVTSQLAGNSRWRCTECETTQTPQQVDTVLQQFKKTLGTLDRKDVDACDKLLQTGLKLFHENHFYLTELKVLLAELIGQGWPGMKFVSDQRLELKMQLCRQMLALADTIFPAVRRVTGLLRYELYTALLEASGRRHQLNQTNGLTGNTDLFKDASQVFNEAVSILRCDPKIVPELFYETRGQAGELSTL